MPEQVWSALLATMFLVSLVLVGRKSQWGWALGILDELLWIAYAVTTRQWSFIVSAVVYTVICVRNLVAWRRDAQPAACASRIEHEQVVPEPVGC